MSKRLIPVYLILFLLSFAFFAPSAYAVTFDPIPPTTPLTRGQDFNFGINIDTQGESITTIQSGITFDPALLQYISVTAGSSMSNIVADTTTYGPGKVLFTGTNNAGFNGTGVFATVVFKLIAEAPGQTEICSLWLPEPTPAPSPTAGPTPTPGPNPTAGPTPTPGPTLPPQPTALPKTGITDSRNTMIVFAASFLAAAGGVFYLSQKQKYSFPESSLKKSEGKSKTHLKS